MPKIVLIETISTFRHLFAVEVKDDEPIEHALDDITSYITGGEVEGLEDFSQNHVGEDISSYREVSEEEYIKIFDKENDYLKDWTAEQKKQYIYKGEE